MMMTSNSPGDVAKIQSAIDDLISFLEPYIPLANQNTIDFFLEELWTRTIPGRMRAELMSIRERDRLRLGSYPVLEHEILIEHADDSSDFDPVCEDLVIAWEHDNLLDFLNGAKDVYRRSVGPDVVSDLGRLGRCLDINDMTEQSEEVLNVKHMISPKKIHEVEKMARLCSKVADGLSISTIVDIGSGKGYLGTALAHAYQRNVLGIDCSESNTSGALVRSQKIDKKITNLKRRARADVVENPSPYRASTEFVTAETDFQALIEDYFPDSSPGRCLLTGLHTCGNLAAYSLRIFVHNAHVSGVCNVGCCYEHLTQHGEITPSGESPPAGFPMSAYVRGRSVSLVKQVRSLASQPLARIAAGLMRPSNSLYWRAVLQVILTEANGGHSRDTWMVGKAGNKCQDFVSYCRKALDKLNKQELSEKLCDEVLLAYESRYSDRAQTIYSFYQLRIVLSPLIESLILLDRLLYLHEQECVRSAHLVRLFDPVTSPRCYALIAWKHSEKSVHYRDDDNDVGRVHGSSCHE